ncbi:MAG TPA: Rid family hydrolase, partial [Candidatus Saccharimonadia bacterium]|nr:Rid family hydrolase [Candidatus Saccharimonadia bacterium]
MTHTPLALLVICLIVAPARAAETPRKVEFLNSPEAAKMGFPFSQAVRAGDTLYLSGQIGIDPATGKLVAGGIEPETRRTMQNIKEALEAHGHSLVDVVKCTAMLADIAEW